MDKEKPKYRTWVRTRVIVLFFILTLFSVSGALVAFLSHGLLLLILPALAFGYILIMISASSYRFSPKGGDYQNRIHNLIVDAITDIPFNHILDIGCGSGHLVITIAKRYSNATLTGIDFWGKNWEYSKEQTERNSELEGVRSRTQFFSGTASKLMFHDNSFDHVVSCLTFHEVRDITDKLVCISEAIRVLKPGGQFILFDLFLDMNFYPSVDDIKNCIKHNGADVSEIKKLEDYFYMPFPLTNKKVLGYAAMIRGRKA